MKTINIFLAVTAAALLCLPPVGLRAQQFNTNPVELPSSTVWQTEAPRTIPPFPIFFCPTSN